MEKETLHNKVFFSIRARINPCLVVDALLREHLLRVEDLPPAPGAALARGGRDHAGVDGLRDVGAAKKRKYF